MLMQGVVCGEQPYKVLTVCVLVIGLCCLGLLRFDVETNPQRLWVGSGSLAAKEKAQYEVNCQSQKNLHTDCMGCCSDLCLLEELEFHHMSSRVRNGIVHLRLFSNAYWLFPHSAIPAC